MVSINADPTSIPALGPSQLTYPWTVPFRCLATEPIAYCPEDCDDTRAEPSDRERHHGADRGDPRRIRGAGNVSSIWCMPDAGSHLIIAALPRRVTRRESRRVPADDHTSIVTQSETVTSRGREPER